MEFPEVTYPTILLDSLTNPTRVTPTGGLGVTGWGGCLYVTRGSPQQTLLLDVARWRLAASFCEQAAAIGGMMGATSSRRTGYAYVWEADIVVDLRVPAEMALRVSPGIVAPRSRLQVEALFCVGTADPPGWPPIAPRYYWIPRAHLDQVSPLTDASAKKRARLHISGCANSHVFLLPEQGTPNDPSTPAGAYAVWLSTHA